MNTGTPLLVVVATITLGTFYGLWMNPEYLLPPVKAPVLRVIEVFHVNHEIPAVKLRMEEHKGIVDLFVILENTVTHQGNKKRLEFFEHRDEFDWKHIDYKVIPTPPEYETRCRGNNVTTKWFCEQWDRKYIGTYMSTLMRHGDLIIFSDCDEVIDRSTLIGVIEGAARHPMQYIKMPMYKYSFYRELLPAKGKQHRQGAVACRYERCNKYDDWYSLRYPSRIDRIASTAPVIPNGGWHMSTFGSIGEIQSKMASFSHADMIRSEIQTAQRVREGLDLSLSNPVQYTCRPNPPNPLPVYAQTHPQEFDAHFMRYQCY